MTAREIRALKNALASAAMEGFTVTAQAERDTIRLYRKEITVAELVREILNRQSGSQG